jgi:CO dehydrogenase maturation factor
MQNRGWKIAISGKGGVGKTTVCAVWSELFARDQFEVLAIDADSNPNLALALGVPAEKTPAPLIEMKHLIEERTEAKSGSSGQYFKLNPYVADLPEKYCLQVKGIKLLVVGGVEQAGGGCACPEGAFLKALLSYSILQQRQMILVDLGAGLEFMGRASVQGLDVLVVVVEPGSRSIETAHKVAQMAQQMGIAHVAAIANKVADAEQRASLQDRLGKELRILGAIPYDKALPEADWQRRPVFGASKRCLEELRRSKETLTKILAQEQSQEAAVRP